MAYPIRHELWHEPAMARLQANPIGSPDEVRRFPNGQLEILGLAGPDELYVSGTTRELLAGSSLAFEDRGEHEVKGVSGRRRALPPGSSAGLTRGIQAVSPASGS